MPTLRISQIERLFSREDLSVVEKWLAHQHVWGILVSTGISITRRSLSTFRQEIPDKSFSVVAVLSNGGAIGGSDLGGPIQRGRSPIQTQDVFHRKLATPAQIPLTGNCVGGYDSQNSHQYSY